MFVLFFHVLLGTTSESHLGWFRVKSVRFSGFPWLQGNRSQQEGHFGQEHCAVRFCAVWIDEKLLRFPRIWWGAHLCLSQWGTLYPESAPNPSKYLECTLAPMETLWIFFSIVFEMSTWKNRTSFSHPSEKGCGSLLEVTSLTDLHRFKSLQNRLWRQIVYHFYCQDNHWLPSRY